LFSDSILDQVFRLWFVSPFGFDLELDFFRYWVSVLDLVFPFWFGIGFGFVFGFGFPFWPSVLELELDSVFAIGLFSLWFCSAYGSSWFRFYFLDLDFRIVCECLT
jgi:hypothetical protein